MNTRMSATDVAAWAVVNLGVALPFEALCELSPSDRLYQSLTKAWNEKQDREDRRFALVCAVLANANSGKRYTVDDFMPKKAKSTKEVEDTIRANFMAYNAAVTARK